MKRALVLCGGGSRGAYEIGAWRALTELGVRFQGVYGTSIGALNAALVARGDVEAASQLWQNIRLSQIMTVEDEDDFAIERMVSNKRDVIPFWWRTPGTCAWTSRRWRTWCARSATSRPSAEAAWSWAC